MILYLIRHGKTEDHEKDIRQAPHSPLGEYGKRQAEAVALKLRDMKFDHLYSSDLPRAKQTAEKIAEKVGMEVRINNMFREAVKSERLDGLPYEGELNQRFLKERDENRENFDWKFDGEGESLNELIERGKGVLTFLIENHHGERVAVVSHAYLIGVLTSLMLLGDDYDEKSFLRLLLGLKLENTGVCQFEYEEDKGKWKMWCFNDHSHLVEAG